MKLANGISEFLVNVLNFYRDYFKKTYPVALICSFATVIAACLLLLNAPISFGTDIRNHGFILQLYKHASAEGTYYIIDLYKTCYLLFISFFAIGFTRSRSSGNFSLAGLISVLKRNDLFIIVLAGIVAAGFDLAMYFLMHSLSTVNGIEEWLWYICHELRDYGPMLIFSIAVCYCIFGEGYKFKARYLGLHFVCGWIFYSFSYNFSILYKDLGTTLILSPIAFGDTRFFIELFLMIPLLAFFFMSFTSVLTFPIGYYRQTDFDMGKNIKDDEVREEAYSLKVLTSHKNKK